MQKYSINRLSEAIMFSMTRHLYVAQSTGSPKLNSTEQWKEFHGAKLLVTTGNN